MPLFDGIPDEELSDIAETLLYRSYHRGDAIYRQEDPPGSLYWVIEGFLKVCLETPGGRQFTTNWMKPDSFFGLISVLDDQARLADAIAVEPSKLFLWPRDAFRAFLDRHPDKTMYMLEVSGKRWRVTMERLYDLAFLDVPGRTAKALLTLAERDEADSAPVIRNITHAELAAFIGTSRESTSRWIRSFEEKGLIKADKGRVQIINESGLRDQAGV